MLSTPINVYVLQALAEGPRSLVDLRRHAGSPPQTTMRGHLRTLAKTEVVVRRRQNDFPGSLDFELTPTGEELWLVAKVLRVWLRNAPEEPLALGSSAAKSAVKALVEGWGTSMVRALAARPLSLTELNGLINGLSYPSLERRLGAMRLAGQIQRTPGRGRGTPYAVTDWLRRAIGPLGVAARWERMHAPEATAPIRRLDAEAAFLLAIPLVRLRKTSPAAAGWRSTSAPARASGWPGSWSRSRTGGSSPASPASRATPTPGSRARPRPGCGR